MIPLLLREAVRALDREASERFKVPSLVLMENAGLGATRVLLEAFEAPLLERVLLIGGPGQNGGDAWVVARQLLARGFAPRCILVSDPAKVQGDARTNLEALRALGLEPEVCQPGSIETLERALLGCSSVVDGLFGTGLDRDIVGFQARVIEAVQAAAKPVLALDLPSGVDADTGQLRGPAVRARCTVTFAAHKPGLHQFPGVEHVGELHCVGIGVPLPSPQAWGLIEGQDLAAVLPPRGANAHKGTSGRLVIFAGSAGKTGAALLSALSALRSGAGLVTIATDRDTQAALDHKVVEIMTAALSEQAALEDALELAKRQDAAVLGPGFGLTPARRTLANELAQQLALPCVLDADALTALGPGVKQLRQAAGPRVLTPHPGEASRLLGSSIGDIESDRCRHARQLAELCGQVVVLKGARSVIAAPDGALRVCRSGTPALATAGTGDVLSGVIASLCVHLPPFTAAWAGVELHARAGSLAAAGRDRGLLAHEVTQFLSPALDACREPR